MTSFDSDTNHDLVISIVSEVRSKAIWLRLYLNEICSCYNVTMVSSVNICVVVMRNMVEKDHSLDRSNITKFYFPKIIRESFLANFSRPLSLSELFSLLDSPSALVSLSWTCSWMWLTMLTSASSSSWDSLILCSTVSSSWELTWSNSILFLASSTSELFLASTASSRLEQALVMMRSLLVSVSRMSAASMSLSSRTAARLVVFRHSW